MITKWNSVEFRHLTYFKTLARTLNYRKAAEILLISQPALSKQIKLLESLLGYSLFMRNNKEVRLTASGKAFYTEAILLLERRDQMIIRLEEVTSGKKGNLKVGLVSSSMVQALPEKIVDFIRQYPKIEINFEELSNREQLDLLQKRELDIGFIRTNEIPTSLNIKSIYKENFMLLLPKKHTINHTNFTDLSDLANDPFILLPNLKSSMYYNKIVSICMDAGFSPKVVYTSINPITVFKLVESGLGISILPASFKDLFNLEVTQIELKLPNHYTELFAVWNKDHNNKALQNFLEVL